MKKRSGSLMWVASLVLLAGFTAIPANAQASAAMKRAPDGKPDFSGFWQVLNSAAWDLQDHSGQLDVPPGQSVVEGGGEIPYQPAALEKKKQNYAQREMLDPTEHNCYLPGVPRVMYMPYPFQIIQNPNVIGVSSEFGHASRFIHMDVTKHFEDQPDTYMGDSRGHWDGDTLVVDVNTFNDATWLDHAGDFHSEALHVTERYNLTDNDHIQYEATIEDPKVFTRPWKISMPMYRLKDPNLRILEYECVSYLQDERFKNAPFKKK